MSWCTWLLRLTASASRGRSPSLVASDAERMLHERHRTWLSQPKEPVAAQYNDGFEDPYMLCPTKEGCLAAYMRSLCPTDIQAVNAELMPRILRGDVAGIEINIEIGWMNDYSSPYYKTVTDRFARLQQELTRPGFRKRSFNLLPVVHTVVDRKLTAILAFMTGKLVVNGLLDHAERNGVIVVGARGTGKSNTLRRFALSAVVAYERLRVVYIDAGSCSDVTHPLHRFTLVQATASALDLGNEVVSVNQLVRKLEEKDLYALVMLDEMERIYQVDLPTTLATVTQIKDLSTNSKGRTLFVGCGSTTLVHLLVRAALPDPLHPLFPLASKSEDMNGTKLVEVRLPSSPPTATAAVDAFFEVTAAEGGICRIIAAWLGTTARALHCKRVECMSPMEQLTMNKHTAHVAKAFLSVNVFLHVIYDLLLRKNEALLQLVALSNEICWSAVRDIEWDNPASPHSLVPLVDSEIDLAWRSYTIIVEEASDATYKRVFMEFLSDSGVIVMEQSVSVPRTHRVFPQSLFAMVAHKHYVRANLYGLQEVALAAQQLREGGRSTLVAALISKRAYTNLAKIALDVAAARV